MSNASKATPVRGCVVEALESRRLLSAADALDPSFAGGGLANVDFGQGVVGVATDVAVQADGKTVVVGYTTGATHFFAVARFNFDGSLDTTFGSPASPGSTVTNIGNQDHAQALAVAIQGDGKILVAGEDFVERSFAFDGSDFAVARYLPNGRLDPTFDGDGIRTIKVRGQDEAANAIALQNDGKIVLAGKDLNGTLTADADFAVVRLRPDGSLDSSFDGNGKKTISMGGDEAAEAIAIDYLGSPSTNTDYGKIVLVGTHNSTGLTSDGPSQVAIARLTPSGHLDTSFFQSGYRVGLQPAFNVSTGEGVLIQPGGKIVVAGSATDRFGQRMISLERFNPQGSLDPTFGRNRSGVAAVFIHGTDSAFDVIPTANGGLLAGGVSGQKFALAAFSKDGLPDLTFGTNGTVVTDFGSAVLADSARLARGPGHRYVLAGGGFFSTARYFDAGANVVSVGSLDPNASEQGGNPASLIVGRSERLPVPTRVYFSIGGTARRPGLSALGSPDYTVAGMTIPNALIGTPYVDIPAGQTYTVVTLTPIDDAAKEGTETATFTIAPNAAYSVGTPGSATISIADNDQLIFAA
jgi:uncharacterized delta-60 repeat protein